MPAPGNHTSKHSYSSSVAPGPPCSSSTLRSGLVPTRLVQTRKSPTGVVTGTSRAPPATTSSGSQVEVSKSGVATAPRYRGAGSLDPAFGAPPPVDLHQVLARERIEVLRAHLARDQD